MKEPIVIVGCSGHGKVVLDAARCQGKYDVVGFLDRDSPPGRMVLGIPILGPEEFLREAVCRYGVENAFVAIGDNWTRRQVAERLRAIEPQLGFATIVHPGAHVARDVQVGQGTVIMAGAVVNPGSVIGEFCIVNTRACLDHDGAMDDFSSLGPGATTGGNVSIGAMSAVAIGATVFHGTSIGRHTVVGARALVTRCIPESVVAYGTPARVVRGRQADEKYL